MLRIFYLTFTLLFISFNSFAKTVFVVESYHASHPWSQSYRQGLQETIGLKHQLIYFEMDTKRIPVNQFKAKADLAWKKYQELSPDLVVLADDNALQALAPRLLKTNVPVVYFGINANPRKYGITDALNFSGVLERPLIKRSTSLLRKFMSVDKALLLFDHSETSNVILEEMFYKKDSLFIGGVNLDIKQIASYATWKEQILAAKQQGYDAIFIALYHTVTEEDGTHIDSEALIKWTSQHTPIPSFGFWDFSIGANKNVGGYVISGYYEGKRAGVTALKILQGKSIGSRTKTGAQGRFVFSKTQLKKWNIELPQQIYDRAEMME